MHTLFNWLLRDRQSQTTQLIKENQRLKQQLATKLDITLNDIIELVEEIRTFNAGAVDKPLDSHIDAALDSWVLKNNVNTTFSKGCNKYKKGCTFMRKNN